MMDSQNKWFDLEEDEFNQLLRISKFYRKQASFCAESKAYLAGCVMSGAALEAVLITFVHLYGEGAEKNVPLPKKNDSIKPLLDWTLNELIQLARKMTWLPSGLHEGENWNTRKAKIGDYAIVLKEIRNLIHPTRYLKDHSPRRITKKYLSRSLEILDTTLEYLAAHNARELKKKLENVA